MADNGLNVLQCRAEGIRAGPRGQVMPREPYQGMSVLATITEVKNSEGQSGDCPATGAQGCRVENKQPHEKSTVRETP